MKEGYCIVRFLEGKVAKVAHLEFVRHGDTKKPFEPSSSQDLPEGPMQAKWQKSMRADDFDHDGYYDVEVLAISRGYDSVLGKAKDLGIKFPGNPMITLPDKLSLDSDKPKSRRRSSINRSDSSAGRNVSDKKKTSGSRNSSKGTPSKRKSDIVVTSSDTKKSRSKPDAEDRKDATKSKETLDVAEKADVSDTIDPAPIESLDPASTESRKKVKSNKTAKDLVRNERLSEVASLAVKSNPLMSKLQGSPGITKENNVQVVKSSPLNFRSPVNESTPSVDKEKQSPVLKRSDVKKTLWKSDETVCTPEKISTPGKASDSDLDLTLPTSIKDMPLFSMSESDASSDSSDGEDIAGKLVEAQLQIKNLKSKLVEAESNTTLSNNMRLKQKEQIAIMEGDVRRLKKELNAVKEELVKLKKRNECLQDLLMNKGLQDKDTDEHVHQNKRNSSEEKEVKVESRDSDISIDLSEKKAVKEGRQKAAISKQKSKGKQKSDIDLENDEYLSEAYNKVLKHLSGEQVLIPDKHGLIDIGNNIHVKRESFDQNFIDHKLNLSTATRNLASLAWTKNERIARSLEGGINNKYPDQPAKKMATPQKVMTVLGAVKAHMINQGDTEGPRLYSTLKSCRKAIGVKFAQDSYNSSR